MGISCVIILNSSYIHKRHLQTFSYGQTHYKVVIVSDTFLKKMIIFCHRIVLKVLESLIMSFRVEFIHSISIKTLTDDRFKDKYFKY